MGRLERFVKKIPNTVTHSENHSRHIYGIWCLCMWSVFGSRFSIRPSWDNKPYRRNTPLCLCTHIFSVFLTGCVFALTGYERYNAMRADSDLCFLERVGMPDVTALSAEQGGGEGASDMADRWSTHMFTHTHWHMSKDCPHVHKHTYLT